MHFLRKRLYISTHLKIAYQRHITARQICVLGIETSCDDTGIAIINCTNGTENPEVLANVLNSQEKVHTRYGGIIPPRAEDLHRAVIKKLFRRSLDEANVTPEMLNCIAITTKPGLPLSLLVGVHFAKYVARKYKIPLVPVHHMEAHALQARMEYRIPFPFLCLLLSGGHSQLAFVQNPFNYVLLGGTLDDAPGEAFDKIARRLRLFLHPTYRGLNGGKAIEDAAKHATNAETFQFPLPLAHHRNCNFSFAGIKNNSFRAIKATEQSQGIPPDCIINNYNDFCAGLLRACSRHIINRTQRAIEFCLSRNFFNTNQRSVVVSGGVANNDYIFNDIKCLAAYYGCNTYRPSKKYCSDNGVMIAWNAIEQISVRKSSMHWNYDEIYPQGKQKLGISLCNDVEQANIKCKRIKLKK